MADGSHRRRGRFALKWGGNLLILAGLAVLGWCGSVLWDTHTYQVRAWNQLRVIPRTTNPSAAEGTLIGWIDVPKVGISAAVVNGVDPRVLRVAVGHIPGTALPWQRGNVALAGHRDTFFRGLRHVRVGDGITLTTPAGAYAYIVDSVHVVEPTDMEVLGNSKKPVLTLVTCYPFDFIGPAPKRFIVRARQVSGSDHRGLVATGNG